MSTLESNCELAAKQAATIITAAYLALPKEVLECYGIRYFGRSAEEMFKQHALWKLIELLDMSVIDLE